MKVLVIDEKNDIAESLLGEAQQLEVEMLSAATVDEGVLICEQRGADIVLMRDIISGCASCSLIQDFKNTSAVPEIIIYAEHGYPEHAEQALEGGAWDYFVDPAPGQKLPDVLRRVVRFRRNKSGSTEARQREFFSQLKDYGIIGSSGALQNCLNLVARVGQSDASVLITGETGTGKELFASAIHNISPRSRHNLTIIDCAALPSTLVESILFGHAKGSFTGADRTQKGLVKQADGGTLFLDEIGEMPLEIQKKFLRVLQEKEYLPVGSRTPEASNFRTIAATNKDLEAMAEAGEFREDLLFRLKTFQLELPPLRLRKTDIAELVYHFRNRYSKQNKLKKKKLATDYMMTLNQYDWPGNVRELFQAVEFSMANAHDSVILEAVHLPVDIRLTVKKKKMEKRKSRPGTSEVQELPDKLTSMPTMKEDRERAILTQERSYLLRLLKLAGGDIQLCRKTAGLSRSRFYDLLKKHGLSQNTTTLHPREKI